MGYWFATRPTDDGDSRSLYLAVDDVGKAVSTFEMDVFTCHLALRMISAKSGVPVSELYDGSKPGRIRSDIGGEVHDRVFNDVTCFCEFFMNRILPLSDKMIKDILVHTRFTLSYILSVDPTVPGHSVTVKGKTRNLAMFRLKDNDNNDLHHISHFDYNSRLVCENFGCGEYSCAHIVDVLGIGDECARYYDTILGELAETGERILVDLGRDADSLDSMERSVPLTRLIADLEDRCGKVEALRYHIRRDVSDMSHGRVCEDESMMANVRVRDNDIESSPEGIDEAYRNNVGIVEEAVWFVRILSCVLSKSKLIDHRINLEFHIESLMRLLDPDLFGRRYVAPDMVFVECEALRERYVRNFSLNSLDGKRRIRGEADSKSETWKAFERTWKYSDRKGSPVREEELVCIVKKPESAPLRKFEPWEGTDPYRPTPVRKTPRRKGQKPTSIMVTDEGHVFDLVSDLGAPGNKDKCQDVRLLVVVTDSPGVMVTRNRDSDEIPEIRVGDLRDLFDIHTEYVIPKMAHAAASIRAIMRQPDDRFEERVFGAIEWFCDRAERTVRNFTYTRRRTRGIL